MFLLKVTNFLFTEESYKHVQVKCKEYGHSTPDMAADIAIRSKAKHLVLFHLSPRYKPITECSEDESDSANILLKVRSCLKKIKYLFEAVANNITPQTKNLQKI